MQVNGFLRKNRVKVLCFIAAGFSAYLIYTYGKLALVKAPVSTTTSPSVLRGAILDKNGKSLAISTNYYDVVVSPDALKDLQKFASAFSGPLELNYDSLLATLTESKGSNYVYIKRKIDQNTYEILRGISDKNGWISAVRFDRIPGRIYPENNLASQVIGYMGKDGAGLSGIMFFWI